MEDLELIELVEKSAVIDKETINSALKQYDPLLHNVFDADLRKKKEIQVETGLLNADGEPETRTKYEEVNRIAFPFQKLIVKRRVAFMNVGKMNLYAQTEENSTEERLLDMVKKCLNDNKFKYKVKEVARRTMSELHSALLFYSETGNTGYWGSLSKSSVRFRMRVLSPTLGDELIPIYDEFGDMTHLARGYKVVKGEDTMFYMDVYDKDYIHKYQKEDGGDWAAMPKVKHGFSKIPLIYFPQDDYRVEWADVQSMIDRLEELISNFADSNDYNGSPILIAKGIIKGFSAKGERGKVLEIDGDGDVKYASWDQAPESIRLEIETLIDSIYQFSQTANISPDKMSGMGVLSGAAMDRILLDPNLAAADKLDGPFGESLQRVVNFLKSACLSIDSSLTPAQNTEIETDIPEFKINDTTTQIQDMATAGGGEVTLSKESRVKVVASAMGIDPEEEWARVRLEMDEFPDLVAE